MIDPDVLLDYLGAQPEQEELVMAMEAAAVAMLERQTGRYFGPVRDQEVVLSGDCGRTLYLEGPVVLGSVVSVDERYYIGAEPNAIELDASDGYVVRGDRLLRAGGLGWCYEYTVAYEQGYARGEEPADVREAVKQLTRWQYQAQQAAAESGVGAYQSETIGDYSYQLADAGSGSAGDWNAQLPFVVNVVNTWRILRV